MTILSKMPAQMGNPVAYTLITPNGPVAMNGFLGRKLALRHTGRIFCQACGKQTKKSWGGGFCYPCMVSAPEAAECIVRPELCQAHLGLGRDVEWEKSHHLQPHVVYLALSSGLKVGVTRSTQVPTRWIDQGAEQAIIIAQVPYRQLAGAIEVALKKHYNDKTNWQAMLKGEIAMDNLLVKRKESIHLLETDLAQYADKTSEIQHIHYPLLDVPKKVTSVKFDNTPEVAGVLTGIKAQYLIFDNTRVFNVRNHSGFEIVIEA